MSSNNLKIVNREKVIEALAEDDLECFAERNYIISTIIDGCKGLKHMSDDELVDLLEGIDPFALNKLLADGDIV
jgi:hypothetical protein